MAGWGSQLNLFQIGHTSFHGHLMGYHGDEIKARGKTEMMVSSHHMLMPDAQYLIEPRKYKMKLQLFSTEIWGSGELIQRFKSQIGAVTDIFAYEIVRDNPDKIVCGCPMCECCACQLLWLHNIGRIVSISIDSKDYMMFEATIELEVQSYWKSINRAIWKWRPVGADSKFLEDWEGSWRERISVLPNCKMLENRGACKAWYKRCRPTPEDLYDPDFFEAIHCYLPLGYPETGYTSNWSTVFDRHFIHVPDWRWSAPPMSIYYFDTLTDLSAGDEMTIVVERNNKACTETCTTTIYYDLLDAELTSYGITLQATDVLAIGDVRGLAHLLRNGEIIAYLASAVDFTCGTWPGQILPGSNVVEVDPISARYSMHHWFRRL